MIAVGKRSTFLICSMLFAGCSLSSKDTGFDDVRREVEQRVDYRTEWAASSPVDTSVDTAVRRLLESELVADSAVQIALLNNRNLQGTFEELGIARADLIQSGLLTNPVITFERRFSGKALELDVVQELVEVLTMPLRRRVAANAFEAAKLRVADAIIDLVAEVQEAFYLAQGAEQLADMRSRVLRSTEVSAELAQRMFDAGNITSLALRMEQRFVRQAQLDLAEANAEAIQLREALNSLMGVWGVDTGWHMVARLPDMPADETTLAGLESLAVSQRLDLAAARRDLVTAAETLGLTNTLRWIPGVSGHVHLEREPDGASTIGPGIELILPIFDWGQAAVPRDQALLRQKQQGYIALAVEIRAQVRAAYTRMRYARDRAEFYLQTVLPLQVEILEQAQLQYNAMILGPLHLFQLKQAEIDTGREYVEALQDYWVARAEVQHAVGGRFGAVPVEPPVQPAEIESTDITHPSHDH